MHLAQSFWPQSTQWTVAWRNFCFVEQTSQYGSGLQEASLASISSCRTKLALRPRGPFSGMVNFSLHSGHFATDPGCLSSQWPWRQPRQNVCWQGSTLGPLKRSMHIEHVVNWDTCLCNRDDAAIFGRCYNYSNTCWPRCWRGQHCRNKLRCQWAGNSAIKKYKY